MIGACRSQLRHAVTCGRIRIRSGCRRRSWSPGCGNCWVLGWNGDHFLRFLGGEFGAFQGFWHGNIFHPDPYALAYSEFLLPQSLMVLPVYAATGNLILCYNLLFLSTFALSASSIPRRGRPCRRTRSSGSLPRAKR